MSKLLKYLKGHLLPIFFIFILLIIQAFCELSLPDYTSDIVNVGIQQSGIAVSYTHLDVYKRQAPDGAAAETAKRGVIGFHPWWSRAQRGITMNEAP